MPCQYTNPHPEVFKFLFFPQNRKFFHWGPKKWGFLAQILPKRGVFGSTKQRPFFFTPGSFWGKYKPPTGWGHLFSPSKRLIVQGGLPKPPPVTHPPRFCPGLWKPSPKNPTQLSWSLSRTYFGMWPCFLKNHLGPSGINFGNPLPFFPWARPTKTPRLIRPFPVFPGPKKGFPPKLGTSIFWGSLISEGFVGWRGDQYGIPLLGIACFVGGFFTNLPQQFLFRIKAEGTGKNSTFLRGGFPTLNFFPQHPGKGGPPYPRYIWRYPWWVFPLFKEIL